MDAKRHLSSRVDTLVPVGRRTVIALSVAALTAGLLAATPTSTTPAGAAVAPSLATDPAPGWDTYPAPSGPGWARDPSGGTPVTSDAWPIDPAPEPVKASTVLVDLGARETAVGVASIQVAQPDAGLVAELLPDGSVITPPSSSSQEAVAAPAPTDTPAADPLPAPVPAPPAAATPASPDPAATAPADPSPTPTSSGVALDPSIVTGAEPGLLVPDLKAPPVRRAQVDTLAPETVRALGSEVTAFQVTRADGDATPGVVQVRLDVSAYLHQHGAGWVSRLRVLHQPGCVLDALAAGSRIDTKPPVPAEAARCAPPVAVPTAYDAKTQTLVALVPADPDPSAITAVAADGTKTAAALPAVVSAPTAGVNTLAAGASGSTGDYRASGLSPAGQWSHGGSSGSFQYKYPFELPKTINGAAFPLALTYDSGSVDGMSQATNNQASWVGLGWDLPIGSIERRYKPCADDGTTDSRAADMCWVTHNAVLSLNGQSGELVKSGPDAWHLASDPGWRI